MPFVKFADGVKIPVLFVVETDPPMLLPPVLTVNVPVVIVDWSISSENVALIVELRATFVSPSSGLSAVTAGLVVSMPILASLADAKV